MDQVSKLLEDVADGLSGRDITQEIKGRAEHIRSAIDALAEGGWVERGSRTGRGGGVVFTITHPYREGDKTPEKEVRPSASKCVPDAVPVSASQSHSPYGVGRTTDEAQDDLLGRSASGRTSETNEVDRCPTTRAATPAPRLARRSRVNGSAAMSLNGSPTGPDTSPQTAAEDAEPTSSEASTTTGAPGPSKSTQHH